MHTVRFWSMLGIVAMHSYYAVGAIHPIGMNEMMFLTQFFKFGTIGFFLISGFLMGDRLQSCDPLAYLGRRLNKIAIPWLLWLVVCTTIELLLRVFRHGQHIQGGGELVSVALHGLKEHVYNTSFWFVPNLLIGMCTLLIFRKYLYNLRFGAVLLACDLFYTVNIYGQWTATTHTEAAFGFVFYLWLGAWSARNFARVQAWLARFSWTVLVAGACMSLIASFVEAYFLKYLQGTPSFNTLRITNQLFSVTVVLLLIRIQKPTWPRFINVAKQTFGVYLVHNICIITAVSAFCRTLPKGQWTQLYWTAVPVWVALSAASYGLCVLAANVLLMWPQLSWTIGVDTSKKQERGEASNVASNSRSLLRKLEAAHS